MHRIACAVLLLPVKAGLCCDLPVNYSKHATTYVSVSFVFTFFYASTQTGRCIFVFSLQISLSVLMIAMLSIDTL